MENYRVLSRKGEGSFSKVMKAQHKQSNRLVAIKCMKSQYKSMDQVNNLREVQALRRLNPHRNVIDLEEILFDKKSGRMALVFELMDMNIFELIKDRGSERPLSESEVKWIVWQLLAALAHMHKHGIFHRDIKPENILVRRQMEEGEAAASNGEGVELCKYELKVADLGSCRGIVPNNAAPLTEYISTRWYRPPECLLTSGHYDEKMDVWAAGCVMYEVMTLKALFPGDDELDQMRCIHKLLGTPDKQFLERLKSRSPQFETATFDKVKGRGLRSALPANTSESCADLLEKLLTYDADQRITARDALKHRYFKSLRAELRRVRTAQQQLRMQQMQMQQQMPAHMGTAMQLQGEDYGAAYISTVKKSNSAHSLQTYPIRKTSSTTSIYSDAASVTSHSSIISNTSDESFSENRTRNNGSEYGSAEVPLSQQQVQHTQQDAEGPASYRNAFQQAKAVMLNTRNKHVHSHRSGSHGNTGSAAIGSTSTNTNSISNSLASEAAMRKMKGGNPAQRNRSQVRLPVLVGLSCMSPIAERPTSRCNSGEDASTTPTPTGVHHAAGQVQGEPSVMNGYSDNEGLQHDGNSVSGWSMSQKEGRERDFVPSSNSSPSPTKMLDEDQYSDFSADSYAAAQQQHQYHQMMMMQMQMQLRNTQPSPPVQPHEDANSSSRKAVHHRRSVHQQQQQQQHQHHRRELPASVAVAMEQIRATAAASVSSLKWQQAQLHNEWMSRDGYMPSPAPQPGTSQAQQQGNGTTGSTINSANGPVKRSSSRTTTILPHIEGAGRSSSMDNVASTNNTAGNAAGLPPPHRSSMHRTLASGNFASSTASSSSNTSVSAAHRRLNATHTDARLPPKRPAQPLSSTLSAGGGFSYTLSFGEPASPAVTGWHKGGLGPNAVVIGSAVY